MNPYISLLLFMIFFASCNNKKSENYVSINYYKDGSLDNIQVKDKRDTTKVYGIYYYDNGGIQSVQETKNSLREGQFIWLNQNGYLSNANFFNLDKENGPGYLFYEDGAPKRIEYWRNGRVSGYSTYFFHDTIPFPQAFIKFNDRGKVTGMSEVEGGRMKEIVNNADTIRHHLELLHKL